MEFLFWGWSGCVGTLGPDFNTGRMADVTIETQPDQTDTTQTLPWKPRWTAKCPPLALLAAFLEQYTVGAHFSDPDRTSLITGEHHLLSGSITIHVMLPRTSWRQCPCMTHNLPPNTWHTACYCACPIADIHRLFRLARCSPVSTLVCHSVPRH